MSKKVVCCHDPNKEKSTLVFTNMRFMVYPPIVTAVCTLCDRSFDFIQKEDGTYKKMSPKSKKNSRSPKPIEELDDLFDS